MTTIAKLAACVLPFVAHIAAADPLCGPSGKFLGSAFSAAQAPGFAEYWNCESGTGLGAIPQGWAAVVAAL